MILLFMILGGSAKANSVIVEVPQQNSFVIQNDGINQSIALTGQRISFCTHSNFQLWSRTNLIGKSVAAQGNELFININNQWISLNELMVRNGYLYDPRLADAQDIAASERRGEWACAAKDAIFNLVLDNKNQAKIVAAVAMNESKYKGYPWPWTLNVNGKSMYFSSREEAYEKIMSLINAGVLSIDIGITQINWKFHSRYFNSPWDALQPSKNIRVSNMILTSLYQRFGTWGQAIKCYHDCVNPVRGGKYLDDFSMHYEEITNL